MPYYALDYLPYQYLRKAKRGRSGRSAVLGQAVKSAGIRNGNVALFSKITHCGLVEEGLHKNHYICWHKYSIFNYQPKHKILNTHIDVVHQLLVYL